MPDRPVDGSGPLLRALLAAGLVGTLAGLPAPAGAQESADDSGPVYLRLSPEPDRTLTYAHRVRVEVDAPPQLGGERALETRMRLRQTPIRIGADSLDVRIRIAEIGLSADSVSRERLPELSRSRGATYRARMTTRGELVRIAESDSVEEGARTTGVSPVEQSVRMSGFPTLPEEPSRPGDSWVDTTRVRTGVLRGMREGTTLAISRTTLEELRREGGSRIALLSVVTTYTFRPADSARSAVRADMSGSGSSAVRFDVTHGRYLRSESSQDYTVNIRYPGSSRTYSVRFRVESEAQLLGVDGAGEGEGDPGGGQAAHGHAPGGGHDARPLAYCPVAVPRSESWRSCSARR